MAVLAQKAADEGEVVVPGTVLGETSSFEVGAGCYASGDVVLASVVGRVKHKELDDRVVVSVEGARASLAHVVPVVESTVTCRVSNVNPRFAACEILCVGSKSVPGSGFKGIIRKENVRSFEVDRVEMHESFRPGDIVRAIVVSLGSARSYELSTAQTHLGVVSAVSASANAPMVAVSHEAMKCPETGVLEARKVAKID
mmetsp:Transcript_16266/g.28827  ORF Transcript_16266/g.28827 Transcript_16266/m.28827 type:complete len:199 (+) Transcript_16266:23-619(+)